MSQQRLPQHQQNEKGEASAAGLPRNQAVSSVPAMEIDVPASAQTRLSPREQQLLKLQQQEEQLRFLEEQLRLASIDAPSRSRPPSRSGSRRAKTSIRRRNPGVAFCEDVLCYTNPRDYDEIVDSWYSKDELAVFKGERKELIRELKRVNFDLDQIDRSVFHLRGLEPYLSIKYNKYMQKKRSSVLQTVMLEQKLQKGRGHKDAEALRVACCQASAWARERAADLGRRDAKAVGCEPHAAKNDSSWGHESDYSTAPSLCSSASGSTSTHSSLSISSDASLDSLRLRSPTLHKNYEHKVTLERVDELPALPYPTCL